MGICSGRWICGDVPSSMSMSFPTVEHQQAGHIVLSVNTLIVSQYDTQTQALITFQHIVQPQKHLLLIIEVIIDLSFVLATTRCIVRLALPDATK